MNLVCLDCGKVVMSSMEARIMHTKNEPGAADLDGHHIPVNVKRDWCPSNTVRYLWEEHTGFIFMGEPVGYHDYGIADGVRMRVTDCPGHARRVSVTASLAT